MDLIGYDETILASIEPPEHPSDPECTLCVGECICFAGPS